MTGPCRGCGEPTSLSLGTIWLCEEHREAELEPIRAHVVEREALNGVGRQVGLHRIDHGRHAADLGCTACAATWVGIPGDPCPWCKSRRASAIEQQRRILLDQANPERLAVAVAAGIVTDAEARQALERGCHVAA